MRALRHPLPDVRGSGALRIHAAGGSGVRVLGGGAMRKGGNPRPDFESLYAKMAGRPIRQGPLKSVVDSNRPRQREKVGDLDSMRMAGIIDRFGRFREDTE